MARHIELTDLIKMMKKQHPQLVNVPDDVLMDDILKKMSAHNKENPTAKELNSKAESFIEHSQFEEAKELLYQALEMAGQEKDYYMMAWIYKNLSFIYHVQGEHPMAINVLENDALPIAQKINNFILAGAIYHELGNIYQKTGNYSKSIEFFEKSIQPGFYNGDEDKGKTLGNLGRIYFLQHEFNKAKRNFEYAIEIFRRIGDEYYKAMFINHLGNIFLDRDDLEKALEYYIDAVEINERGGYDQELIYNYSNFGAVYYKQGKYNESIQMRNKSLEIAKRIGAENEVASSCWGIGLCYSALNEYNKALEFFNQAIKVLKKIKNPNNITAANTYLSMAELFSNTGETSKAKDSYRKAKETAEIIGNTKMASQIAERLKLL